MLNVLFVCSNVYVCNRYAYCYCMVSIHHGPTVQEESCDVFRYIECGEDTHKHNRKDHLTLKNVVKTR